MGEERVSARYIYNYNMKSINGDLPLNEEIDQLATFNKTTTQNFQNKTLVQAVNS